MYLVIVNDEVVAAFADADLAQQFRKKFFGASVGRVQFVDKKMPKDPAKAEEAKDK